jgi:hypothetical protein
MRISHSWNLLLLAAIALSGFHAAQAEDASKLRLSPFPKEVELGSGTFSLDGKLVLEAPAASAKVLGGWINEELKRAGIAAAEIRPTPGDAQVLRLSAVPSKTLPQIDVHAGTATGAEDYVLAVEPNGVTCIATTERGLFNSARTLRQLIRANRRDQGLDRALPCLKIHDWPSLAWRAFQDDMTRGPSATLDTLKREIDLGGEFKMNMFTYYMEFQYAFKNHPEIGPKDGSLTPEELKALVAYATPRQMAILGSQQSFGHHAGVLSHPEYAALRENGNIISPLKEESYKLLDELYSEVVPLLPFPWFNVCCDETFGLGEGPSKDLVKKIGVGGVYVRHMRRVHDLLKDKYHKRMMMWGDIILQHPDKLDQLPKDIIMLTWGYEPLPSFEHQILPFAKAGYDYFVCPGVDDWGRILPDFGHGTINIQSFVRDGAKHKALGMINTEWKDDACTLRAPAWHGYAWGAECAWTGAATTPEDFNRRIGGVLFGEPGDHFGQAIALLTKTIDLAAKSENLQHWDGMSNRRFWNNDFVPQQSEEKIRAYADPLLALIRPAIVQLQACRKDAVVNADMLDAFVLGARRMELICQRRLDGLLAAKAYAKAVAEPNKDNTLVALAVVERLVQENRAAHQALADEFARLWRTECKPYSLERTMNQYAAIVKWYDNLAAKLADARKQVEAGKPIPSAATIGLAMPAK